MFSGLRCQTPPLQHCIYCSLPCYCTPLPQPQRAHTHTGSDTLNICRAPTLLAGSLMLLYGAGICSLQHITMRSLVYNSSYCKTASHACLTFSLQLLFHTTLSANGDITTPSRISACTHLQMFCSSGDASRAVKRFPAGLHPNNSDSPNTDDHEQWGESHVRLVLPKHHLPDPVI